MEKIYKVTYPCDSLDPNPTTKTFTSFNEMEDWISEELEHRISYTVQHSAFAISEEEYVAIEEYERALIRIEELV